MADLPVSHVDLFLAGLNDKSKSRGSLIFALDATASREETWDMAIDLQGQMFREVAAIGGLDMQLVYFRGATGINRECRASVWVDDPMRLAKMMTKIRCEGGHTQIGRVLEHVARETAKRSVNAVVYVGDACEEEREYLILPARVLSGLGIPVFMFQEGRDPAVQQQFREIAEVTGGAYHRFDQGSAKLLAELLRAVAAFAVGGLVALEKQDSAAAKLLLSQMR